LKTKGGGFRNALERCKTISWQVVCNAPVRRRQDHMLTTPSISPFLITGQRVNLWRVAGIDPTGKRVSAQCTECGAIRLIAASDLHRAKFDCQPLSAAQRREIKEESRLRRALRSHDWKPQR
jgi:hypothetical protein